jgi:hypothetical protein
LDGQPLGFQGIQVVHGFGGFIFSVAGVLLVLCVAAAAD